MTKAKVVLGDGVQIPLRDGQLAYCHALRDASIGIYRPRTAESNAPPIDEEYLLVVGVYEDVLTSGERPVVGRAAFEDPEESWSPPYSMRDAISGQMSIYYKGRVEFPAMRRDLRRAAEDLSDADFQVRAWTHATAETLARRFDFSEAIAHVVDDLDFDPPTRLLGSVLIDQDELEAYEDLVESLDRLPMTYSEASTTPEWDLARSAARRLLEMSIAHDGSSTFGRPGLGGEVVRGT